MRLWRWIKRLFVKKTPVKTDVFNQTDSSNYPEGWFLYALEEVTGKFEGMGYGQITGNFDGQGLSVGILQWNYGQGSLQKILRTVYLRDKSVFYKHFGDLANTVIESRNASNSDGIKLAVSYGNRWVEKWKNFMTDEKVIEVQRDASRYVADRAWRYCQDANMKTLRSFCFFFDTVTQQGSMKGVPKPVVIDDFKWSIKQDGGVNYERWINLKPTDEQLILWQWCRNRVTRNKWAWTVLRRRGAIIFGTGFVNGKVWSFDFLIE